MELAFFRCYRLRNGYSAHLPFSNGLNGCWLYNWRAITSWGDTVQYNFLNSRRKNYRPACPLSNYKLADLCYSVVQCSIHVQGMQSIGLLLVSCVCTSHTISCWSLGFVMTQYDQVYRPKCIAMLTANWVKPMCFACTVALCWRSLFELTAHSVWFAIAVLCSYVCDTDITISLSIDIAIVIEL